MSVSALACGCMCELNAYRRGDVCGNPSSMELLRRATVHRDPLAWEVLQQCLSATVLRWMRRHPLRERACRFDSEENYVAQTFARFWQAYVLHEQLEFRTPAAALRYLRARLNSVVLDTLRTYLRPQTQRNCALLFAGVQQGKRNLSDAMYHPAPAVAQCR